MLEKINQIDKRLRIPIHELRSQVLVLSQKLSSGSTSDRESRAAQASFIDQQCQLISSLESVSNKPVRLKTECSSPFHRQVGDDFTCWQKSAREHITLSFSRVNLAIAFLTLFDF